MGLNSIPPNTNPISTTDIKAPDEKPPITAGNKNIKNLYGDKSKADMLSNYMNRMNTFYANVKTVIDQKKQNSAG